MSTSFVISASKSKDSPILTVALSKLNPKPSITVISYFNWHSCPYFVYNSSWALTAYIVTLPAPTAVTTPVDGSTEATLLSLVDHVTSDGLADVVSCNVSPTFISVAFLPSFLNGTTIVTWSFVIHTSFPNWSTEFKPAVTVVKPVYKPNTLPYLTSHTSVSSALYVTPDVSG